MKAQSFNVTRSSSELDELDFLELRNHKQFVEKVLGRGRRILDVHCGGGVFGEWMNQALNHNVYGVEVNPILCEVAKSRGLRARQFDWVRNVQADLSYSKIPYRESFFDGLHATYLKRRKVDESGLQSMCLWIRECRRVLRVGGKMVLVVPNRDCLENRFRALTGKTFVDLISTIDFYDASETLQCLKDNGFKVECVSGSGTGARPISHLISRLKPVWSPLLFVGAVAI